MAWRNINDGVLDFEGSCWLTANLCIHTSRAMWMSSLQQNTLLMWWNMCQGVTLQRSPSGEKPSSRAAAQQALPSIPQDSKICWIPAYGVDFPLSQSVNSMLQWCNTSSAQPYWGPNPDNHSADCCGCGLRPSQGRCFQVVFPRIWEASAIWLICLSARAKCAHDSEFLSGLINTFESLRAFRSEASQHNLGFLQGLKAGEHIGIWEWQKCQIGWFWTCQRFHWWHCWNAGKGHSSVYGCDPSLYKLQFGYWLLESVSSHSGKHMDEGVFNVLCSAGIDSVPGGK